MNKYLIVTVCMMFFYSCSEENNRAPVMSDSTIPGQVSNVRTERLAGAIKLTYDMPDGQSLSYVKAECLINGTMRQVKASSYVNNLTVEGFADSSMYTIHLYSVNRSEKSSDPVTVQAKPLSPNYREVFKNMELVDDWGGASVIFENPNEAELAINLIYVDNTGYWNPGETFYTKMQQGKFSLRGLQPKETIFGVYIRDRWNNATDTLIKILTPRFERQMDHLKFRHIPLPGEATWNRTAGSLFPEAAWDGDFSKIANMALNPLHITQPDDKWPHWFTLDLGIEKVLLSRFKIWQRGSTAWRFADRNVRKFEIWGCEDAPVSDGSFDGWTLLMDEEIIKPSGLPLGQTNDDDIQVILDGHDFTFPLDIPYVRYIRFVCKETWGKQLSYFMMQIAFWGQDPSNIE